MDKRDELIERQAKVIEEQAKTIKQLEELVKLLQAKIAELEHRLGLNSNNSSKPPSSDGLAKENSIPKSKLKDRKKNKAARKARKKQNSLKQVDNPDHVVEYRAEACQSCHTALSNIASDKHEKRQVFDLPKQQFFVTEHQIHRTICPCCQHKNYGTAPTYVKAHTQYGPNFGAFCVYLNTRQMIPYNRISELSFELFGREVSEAVIINFINQFGKISLDALSTIEANVRAGDVKHVDETGIRVAGSLHWQLVASSGNWTKFWVSKKRGDVMRDLTGVLVRDCFAPYDTYNKEAKMALCNAHLLRDLEAVKDVKGHEWAAKMQHLLLLMNDVKARYISYGKDIPPNIKRIAIERYNALVIASYNRFGTEKGVSALEKKAIALIKRLMERKEDILRFFNNLVVPFTNNAAERDIRMNKVRQKISGCFRTLHGAEVFAAIRSVVVTKIKQGADIIDTISEALKTGKICFSSA